MLIPDAIQRADTGPWLSDSNKPYPDHMPYFYDTAEFPDIAYIEANWEIIRDELVAGLKASDTGLEAYKDLGKTNRKAAWKTAGLIYWTAKSPQNIARFPKTWALFRKIPNLTSCSILLLEPHSTIKPHLGDTDAMVRCHIGLIVPGELPRIGFRCGTEMVSWKEGKAFAFNDAREHTAWNNTDSNRYIVSFDLMRPEFQKRKYWISAQVLGKIDIEVLYQHKAWMRRYLAREWQKLFMIAVCKRIRYVRLRIRAAIYGSL